MGLVKYRLIKASGKHKLQGIYISVYWARYRKKNKFQTPVRLNTTNIKTKMTKTPEKMLNTQIQCKRIMAAAGEVGERKHTDYPPKDQHKLVLWREQGRWANANSIQTSAELFVHGPTGMYPFALICPSATFLSLAMLKVNIAWGLEFAGMASPNNSFREIRISSAAEPASVAGKIDCRNCKCKLTEQGTGKKVQVTITTYICFAWFSWSKSQKHYLELIVGEPPPYDKED